MFYCASAGDKRSHKERSFHINALPNKLCRCCRHAPRQVQNNTLLPSQCSLMTAVLLTTICPTLIIIEAVTKTHWTQRNMQCFNKCSSKLKTHEDKDRAYFDSCSANTESATQRCFFHSERRRIRLERPIVNHQRKQTRWKQ